MKAKYLLALFLLAACAGDKLDDPDITRNAPLQLPPDFELRPPVGYVDEEAINEDDLEIVESSEDESNDDSAPWWDIF